MINLRSVRHARSKREKERGRERERVNERGREGRMKRRSLHFPLLDSLTTLSNTS